MVGPWPPSEVQQAIPVLSQHVHDSEDKIDRKQKPKKGKGHCRERSSMPVPRQDASCHNAQLVKYEQCPYGIER